MAKDTHWANISESGSALGMAFMVNAYRYGGRVVFRIFLFPVILFYFLTAKQARGHSAAYLRRVNNYFGRKEPVNHWRIFQNFWQFGVALMDKIAVWMGKITVDDVVIHNGELIDRLLAEKSGAVINISHFGNFEICNALSRSHEGVKLTVLHHTKHAEKFNSVLGKYNSNSSIEMLQVTDMNSATAMALSERAERGEFIAISGDRVPVDNDSRTLMCDFLGEQAAFPEGPFILSHVLALPVIMIICIRHQGTHHIFIEQLSDGVKAPRAKRAAAIQAMAQKYASRLEHYVSKEPLQWFNFYNFWKLPRKAVTGDK